MPGNMRRRWLYLPGAYIAAA